MREILFRGKRVDNGEWVEGYYFHDIDKRIVTTEADYIIGFADKDDTTMQNIEVVPETVGQYTGLTDKNGRKIFEGDVTRVHYGGKDYIGLVQYDFYGVFIFVARGFGWIPLYKIATDDDLTNYIRGKNNAMQNIKIIGNIHDNPELLEKKK